MKYVISQNDCKKIKRMEFLFKNKSEVVGVMTIHKKQESQIKGEIII